MHGLDELQSLVHQSCRVYRYLGAHRPVRVLKRFLRLHIFQLLKAAASKRASRGGEIDFTQKLSLAAQALKNSRVLRVNGDKLRAVSLDGLHKYAAGHYKSLLVCQSYSLALLYGFKRGKQALCSAHCGQNRIDSGIGGGHGKRSGAEAHLYVHIAQIFGKFLGSLPFINGDKFRPQFSGLFFQKLDVRSGSKGQNLKAVGFCNIHGLRAYAAS